MPTIDKHAPGSPCWFELSTNDQNAAKAFYSNLFDWTISDNPMGPDAVYTLFKIDGQDAAACCTLQPEQATHGVPPNWAVYIATENADATAAKITNAGGSVVVPPFDVMDLGRMAVVQDPAGATFCLWQPGTNTGTQIGGVMNTVGWIELTTNDEARAAKFYGDVFGWTVKSGKAGGPAGPDDYGHIENNGVMIGGIPPASMRDPNAPPNWMIYVEVADTAATTEKARGLGANVIMGPMDIGENGKISVLQDPQGAYFALHQGM
ncbi:MAG TPA: VOC family protein [Vicinamibacterales bacterium]|nr:VOC family protein [Vicinamibacterales bacterium]